MTFVSNVVLSMSLGNILLQVLDTQNIPIIGKEMLAYLVSGTYSTYALMKVPVEHLPAGTVTSVR